MLIFESIIFSSFIPQILMLFGFVSCVAAPYIPGKSNLNKEKIITVSNEQEIDCEIIAEDSNYFFDFKSTDYQSHYQALISYTKQKKEAFLAKINTVKIPLELTNKSLSILLDSFALRAPPF